MFKKVVKELTLDYYYHRGGSTKVVWHIWSKHYSVAGSISTSSAGGGVNCVLGFQTISQQLSSLNMALKQAATGRKGFVSMSRLCDCKRCLEMPMAMPMAPAGTCDLASHPDLT